MDHKKGTKEPTPVELSGRILQIRTSVALEEMLEEYARRLAAEEMRPIDRTEAARRLIAFGLNCKLKGAEKG